jgi:hypothetical protein
MGNISRVYKNFIGKSEGEKNNWDPGTDGRTVLKLFLN